MNNRAAFEKRVNDTLSSFDPNTLAYDKSEFWMIERRYLYVQDYAIQKGLYNTAVALPLVRALHNGEHRKGTVLKDGVAWRLPYVIHCLMVCRMLVDLQLPLSAEEEDIVLASSLCHDMIEDIPFENGGTELYTVYGLDRRVYDTVKLVSKRRDFTDEEHLAYFRKISENRLALLVKLADRGNNVEDLYNMKTWKIHEYIGETRTYFYPMCEYGTSHFPELSSEISILRDKIVTLVDMAEILADRYDKREQYLNTRYEALKQENDRLRAIMQEMEKA